MREKNTENCRQSKNIGGGRRLLQANVIYPSYRNILLTIYYLVDRRRTEKCQLFEPLEGNFEMFNSAEQKGATLHQGPLKKIDEDFLFVFKFSFDRWFLELKLIHQNSTYDGHLVNTFVSYTALAPFLLA